MYRLIHTPTERCLGFILNNTKMDFTVVILHVPNVQNGFRLNPTVASHSSPGES